MTRGTGSLRRSLRAYFGLIGLTTIVSVFAPAIASEREDLVTAGMVYHFATFVDWPNEALTPAPTSFVVGLLYAPGVSPSNRS